MLILLIYVASGYLFFKFMWPLLRNNDPNNKPTEIYNFYEKHPRILILTMILALFGIAGIFNEIGGIVAFIFRPCYPDTGVISLQCYIKQLMMN